MVTVKLDRKGISQILKSDGMAAVMNATAEAVADAASSGTDEPVRTDAYQTDRKAAGVTIASERGETEEAVKGVLTRAAGSVGLEVRPK